MVRLTGRIRRPTTTVDGGFGPAAMRESALQELVRGLCRQLGLLVYHTHDSRRSDAGFPDLVVVGGRVIFRELKTVKGRLTAVQQDWLSMLAAAGADAGVWRPTDWYSGRVSRELQDVARRPAGPPPPQPKLSATELTENVDVHRCGCLVTDVAVEGHTCTVWGPPL